MFQTDEPTASSTLPAPAAAGTPGYFTEGNPASGVPATILGADFLNMVMMELINVVQAGGLTPSKTTYNQVLTAIKSIGQSQVVGIIGESVNLKCTCAGGVATAAWTFDQLIVGQALSGPFELLSGQGLTLNLAATGAGGMYSAAATTGFVAVYAIAGSAGVTLYGVQLASGTVVPPKICGVALPSGYTYSALISTVQVTSGKFPAFSQVDKTHIIGGTTLFGTTTPEASPTAVNISGVVPGNAKTVRGNITVQLSNASTSGNLTVYPAANSIGGKICNFFSPTASSETQVPWESQILTPGSLWYIMAVATGTANVGCSLSEYDIF